MCKNICSQYFYISAKEKRSCLIGYINTTKCLQYAAQFSEFIYNFESLLQRLVLLYFPKTHIYQTYSFPFLFQSKYFTESLQANIRKPENNSSHIISPVFNNFLRSTIHDRNKILSSWQNYSQIVLYINKIKLIPICIHFRKVVGLENIFSLSIP